MALVVCLALLVGLADEIHQSFLPGRVAGWEDLLADAVGVCVALWLNKIVDSISNL